MVQLLLRGSFVSTFFSYFFALRRGATIVRCAAAMAFAFIATTGAVYAQAGFASGCGPFFSGNPNVANFPSGNQLAHNLALPRPLNFAPATQPSNCVAYNAVRVKPAQALPAGMSVALVMNGPVQTLQFTGTPTTLGTVGPTEIEVSANGGTNWATAVRITFDVAACLDWNDSSTNSLFALEPPDLSGHFTAPVPVVGVPYNHVFSPRVTSPYTYAAVAYCPAATYRMEYNSTSGTSILAATGQASPPLSIAVSATPTEAYVPNGVCGDPELSTGFNASVRAFNASGNEIGSFPVCFGQPQASITLTGNPPSGTVGTGYSSQLLSNGATPLTFSVQSGTVPPGLTLSASGLLSGTPTQAGTFSFVAAVLDSTTAAATAPFTIVVNAATVQTASPTGVPTLGFGGLVLLVFGALVTGLRAMRRER